MKEYILFSIILLKCSHMEVRDGAFHELVLRMSSGKLCSVPSSVKSN